MSGVAVIAPPTVDDITSIAAIDNPVLRNLRITECYADLSAAMRVRTGGAADWCTFATWASRQAGSTIRGEDFLDTVDRTLGRRSWLLAPLASISRWLLGRDSSSPRRGSAAWSPRFTRHLMPSSAPAKRWRLAT